MIPSSPTHHHAHIHRNWQASSGGRGDDGDGDASSANPKPLMAIARCGHFLGYDIDLKILEDTYHDGDVSRYYRRSSDLTMVDPHCKNTRNIASRRGRNITADPTEAVYFMINRNR